MSRIISSQIDDLKNGDEKMIRKLVDDCIENKSIAGCKT